MHKLQLTIFLCLLGLFLPLSHVRAGTILSSHKYAWSNNVGYINFANVIVTDSALSGSAWSANKGFIKFNPAQGGVSNNGMGNLSGSAWGEQLGWIDFDNVSINGSTGKFSGTATGALIGTLTFDCPNYCDVRTDWRQAATPAATVTSSVTAQSGGGGGGVTVSPTATPALSREEQTKSAEAKQIDIQKDGVINILDFNALMANWGVAQNLAAAGSILNSADMNKDGIVDIYDFNTLMIYWSTTYQI